MTQPSDTVHPPASLDLALIGNCTVGALVDNRACLVWCCMPRFDSAPVFDALLHSSEGLPRDGAMTVELEGLTRTEQQYDPGTAVLRTRLWDGQGQGIEVVDFAPRFIVRERVFRPAQLVRRVRPLAGHPRVRFSVKPRGDWGASAPTLTRGSHHLRYLLPDITLRLNTNVPLTYLLDGTWFSLHGPVSLLLGPDETLTGGIEETARDFEEATSLHWRHWTHRLALPLEWQDAVIRAAITLKLCQYEETGAIVAAMTTSIPEAAHSGRNWDYRYCWLRDAFFVVRALNGLSEVGTMESYLNWLYNVIRSAPDGRVRTLASGEQGWPRSIRFQRTCNSNWRSCRHRGSPCLASPRTRRRRSRRSRPGVACWIRCTRGSSSRWPTAIPLVSNSFCSSACC